MLNSCNRLIGLYKDTNRMKYCYNCLTINRKYHKSHQYE
nr:MAG TPA: hypothetical protein [Caudoviricetes sp.]